MKKNNDSGFDYKGYAILIAAILLTIVMIFVSIKLWPEKQDDNEEIVNKAEFSDISAICELATVRSFYHNVAELEKFPDGLYKYGYGKFGYKKLWLEYSGTVELGIDVNRVTISEPDENGVVSVYVPKAEILNVYFNKDSMQIPISETGVLTKITTEDEADAFSEAQKNMEEKTAEDDSLFSQAENRAHQLIKAYVLNTGKELGVEYKVKWISDSSPEN